MPKKGDAFADISFCFTGIVISGLKLTVHAFKACQAVSYSVCPLAQEGTTFRAVTVHGGSPTQVQLRNFGTKGEKSRCATFLSGS